MDKVADPEALVCWCGHQAITHVNNERQCEGTLLIDNGKKEESCSCPRFKLWYNNDED